MKKKVIIVSILVIFAFILERIFSSMSFFDKLESTTYDLRAKIAANFGVLGQKFKNTDNKIVIVAIDDYSWKEMAKNPEIDYGTWPWSRNVWTGVTEFIEKGKPKAVLFDMVFSGKDGNSGNDKELAQTFRRYDNIVLGTSLSDPMLENTNVATNPNLSNSIYAPTAKPLKVLVEQKGVDDAITFYVNAPVRSLYSEYNTMGVVNKVKDKGFGKKQAQPLFKLVKGNESYYLPSLAFAGFLKYMGEDDQIVVKNGKLLYKGRKIPVDKHCQTIIGKDNFEQKYSSIPISNILLSEGNNKYVNPKVFKDKIVIIGRIPGKESNNLTIDPTYTYPEACAAVLDNFINNTDPHNRSVKRNTTQIPVPLEYLIIIGLCVAVAFIGLISKNALICFANSLAFILLYILFCFLLFVTPAIRVWAPVAVPLYYLLFTSLGVFAYKFQKELSKRIKIRRLFGKLVSPGILNILLKNWDNLALESSRKNITVLRCDIKNFTSLIENNSSEKLTNNLNELFNEIANIVFENNGTINKFVGDCLTAYWGDPVSENASEDAFLAVKAALAIKKKVNEIKILSAKTDKIIFDVIISINTGEALLGLVGSEKIMNYTAIGEAVNTASYIDSACTKLNKDILISKSTYEKTKDKIIVLEAGRADTKGREKQVEVYEPIGLAQEVVIETEEKEEEISEVKND